MPTTDYYELLQRVRHLEPAEQVRLLKDLTTLVHNQISGRPQQSILDLQGIGKEIWSTIDAQEYVDQERASWNG